MLDVCASDISLIIEAARAVLEYRSFKEAAQKIFNLCKKATGATAGYVALLSKDGSENEVLFLDSGGMPCSVDPKLPMPIRGLRAEAYKTGRPAYENNFWSSKWVNFMPSGHVMMKNVMFAPMILEGKAIGLLGLANKPDDFTDADAEWAAIFAEIAAIALHNSHLVETLEKSEKRYHQAFNRSQFYQNLLAHDINNIFQVIISATEISTRVLNENLEIEKVEEMLNLIRKQFEKGVKLISNVQKLSQLEEDGVPITKIEITELLQKSIKSIRESFLEKKIEINYNLTDKEFYTDANIILLDVFENILHNAIKFNKSNTIEITINLSRELIDASPFLKLEFRDNGQGISDENKKKIFQHSTNKISSSYGLGIGLSLVKKAVEIYKGQIYVEDRVKGDHTKGSNFIILLPEIKEN